MPKANPDIEGRQLPIAPVESGALLTIFLLWAFLPLNRLPFNEDTAMMMRSHRSPYRLVSPLAALLLPALLLAFTGCGGTKSGNISTEAVASRKLLTHAPVVLGPSRSPALGDPVSIVISKGGVACGSRGGSGMGSQRRSLPASSVPPPTRCEHR